MTPVSAIVITFNEADRIAETVSSLHFCDEVLVVDSGSTDRTREIARAMGARVVERAWTGYSDQKNYAAGEAAHDWVFSVDADERPGVELTGEIMRWQRSPRSDAAAVSMPRRVSYLGRWIAHSGWYPDRKIRLYDRRSARWKGVVHEALDVDSAVEEFGYDLLHFPYRSIEEHYATIERYTRLAADELRASGRRFNP